VTVSIHCDRCGVLVPLAYNPVCIFQIGARGEKAERKFRLDLCEDCQTWAFDAVSEIEDGQAVSGWADENARERIVVAKSLVPRGARA
jgi:hypothetical protein